VPPLEEELELEDDELLELEDEELLLDEDELEELELLDEELELLLDELLLEDEEEPLSIASKRAFAGSVYVVPVVGSTQGQRRLPKKAGFAVR
jgi:hypothetical protein